jgi:hypothetical protein
LRQKDEQNQSVAKGLVGWLGQEGSGTQEGLIGVGNPISNRILIKIRRLNFGYAPPMLLGSNDLSMQMIIKKFN